MRIVVLMLMAAIAVSCGGAAESPTAPTSSSGSLEVGPPQTYDSHPEPPVDPEPGADPAPPPPVPEPVPGEPLPEPAPETPAGPAPPSTFDGTYTGSATDGNDPVGGDNLRLTLTVANGVAGVTMGSDTVAGTVSETGAIAASGGECNATITGQITVTAPGVAAASGTWSHPAVICGESANSGTWTATRTTVIPAPAPAPTMLTGRWIGVTPDGNIISDPQSCDSEQDLTLDLTQTGTTLSGTISDRPRKHNPSVCSAPTTGKVVSLTGTVGADVFSFTVPGERGRAVNCSGTFTSTRLAGTCDGGNGTFAVNRQ